jgi:hypothetical protein
VLFIVAIAGALLTHVPPPELVSAMPAPAHTADGPVIGAGNGFIVIVTLPVISAVQPCALVATTVYIPAATWKPKSSEPPVPAIGEPTAEAPI